MPREEIILEDDNVQKVTIEDTEYTLNENGDAIDDKGEVFKSKDEITKLNAPPEEKKKEDEPEDFGEVEIGEDTFKLDKDGNALDSEGKIKHTKEEISKLEEVSDTTLLEIDGVNYTVDDKGNAVDKEGKIVHTKEDIDKMSEVDDDDNPEDIDVNEIIETVGIKITDENGEPIEYTKGKDGITKYISDVANKANKDGREQEINTLFETYPIVRRLIKHLELNNGSPEGFNQSVDYLDIELDKDNTKQLELINLQYFLSRGHSQEEAERFVTYSKNDKKLYDDSVKHLKILQDEQKAYDEQQEQLVAKKKQQQLDEELKYKGFTIEKGKIVDLKHKGSIYDKIVNEGKLKINNTEIQIPKTISMQIDKGKTKNISRQELINYAFIPKLQVVDGQKYMATDYEVYLYNVNKNRTVDNDILDMLNAITGNDQSQLISQGIKQKEVENVRRLRSKSKKGQKQMSKDTGNDGGEVVMPVK